MERKIRNSLIRKISLAVIFIAILISVSIIYTPFIVRIIKSTEEFRSFILSCGNAGVLVFMLLQFSHIIIPFIPGEFIQVAGGYVYGTILGSVFILIGTSIGTVVAFFVSRVVGYPLVKIFVNKEKMEKYTLLLNSGKSEVILIILFLIPGIPKDALIYMAGLTPVKPFKFIATSLLARSPGLIGSAFIGANLLQKDYTSIIIIVAVTLVIFTIGFIFRRNIFKKLGHKI